MPYLGRDEEPHIPEDQLLRKLETWEASLPSPPSMQDVLGSGDAQLIGAYVLRGFRAAAAEAVRQRLEVASQSLPASDGDHAGSAAYRVFRGIAKAWTLTADEQLALLGFTGAGAAGGRGEEAAAFDQPPVLERLAMLLDIFEGINTLLPEEQRADAWMRRPNFASAFGGRSALTLMVKDGLPGIRKVRSYLADRHTCVATGGSTWETTTPLR